MRAMDKSEIAQQAYQYGKKSAPLFNEFCKWLVKSCQQRSITTVYFITREGNFFQACCELLADEGIELKLLATSRLASYGASIDLEEAQPFHRLWRSYPNQSMVAFYNSLGFSAMQIHSLLTFYPEDGQQVIENIADNEKVQTYLKLPEVISLLKRYLEEKKEKLMSYLETLGLNAMSIDVAVVDIGWRGSIQDNLARVFPTVNFHGFYLGLHKFRYSQDSNVQKRAFLFNGNSAEKDRELTALMRFVLPLEFLCSAPCGSVEGYAEGPLYHEIKEETALLVDYSQPFQRGVLEAIRSKTVNEASRHECVTIAKQIVWKPPAFLLHYYQYLTHNEVFGYGEILKSTELLTSKELISAFVSKSARKKVLGKIKNSYWPTAYLQLSLKWFSPFIMPFLPRLYLLFCLITRDSYL